MNNKFVLESFKLYLDMVSDQINEAKGDFEPTMDFVKDYVKRLLEKQKELGKETSSLKPFADQKDPYEAWLNKWKSKKENEGKKFPSKGNATYYGGLAAPYLWEKLEESQKNQVYTTLLDKMKSSGFDKEKQLNNLIKDKEGIKPSPYISITPSFVEISTPGTQGKSTDFEIVGLESGEENKLFKDNRWGSGVDSEGGKVNPDAFNDPAVLEEIRKTINDFIKMYSTGEVKEIKSIKIQSSASRYRNTNDNGGKAEKISWGELSYGRALTIVELFKEAATANNLSDEKKKYLQSKISIESKGSNGDGTSGPNTPAPLKFGYYDEKGNFVLDNGTFSKGKSPEDNRKTLVIAELGEGGKPNGKYTTAEEAPLAGPTDYSQFKYVNFIIQATKLEEIPDEKVIKPTVETKVSYNPVVAFPKKSSGGGFSFKIKKMGKRSPGRPGAGGNPFQCPEF